jgi:hypothetical protein
MSKPSNAIPIYLETGSKRVFAGVLEWPGWCRSGRDEQAAIRALVEYGTRYARAIRSADPDFQPPADESSLRVVERLKGDATTDFGAPGQAPAADSRPMSKPEITRFTAILESCWRTLDRAVKAAGGGELRKGPRGGGRSLEEIVRHLLEADAAYLGKIGWPFRPDSKTDPAAEPRRTRAAILAALAAAAEGRLTAKGPRVGPHWTARYFVRRAAWHTLDHAWEIEDRIPQPPGSIIPENRAHRRRGVIE